MSEPKVLTIQRSKWRRGGNLNPDLVDRYGPTRLLNYKGLMCCLGFDALACGITEATIRDGFWPSSLLRRGGVTPESDYARTRVVWNSRYEMWDESPRVQSAINHNDDDSLSEPERERLVREDLMALGWTDVEFVD